MRVEHNHPGSRVTEEEPLNIPEVPLKDAQCNEGFVDPCAFSFLVCKGRETSVGTTEEACVEELLKQVMMQLQFHPCDDFRRAYYHLVKAQESLKHHRVA